MGMATSHGPGHASALPTRGEKRTISALLLLFWLGTQIVYFFYAALDDALDKGAEISPPSVLLQNLARGLVDPVELAIVGAGAISCVGVYAILGRVRRLPLWGQLLSAVFSAFLGAACFSLTVRWIVAWFALPAFPEYFFVLFAGRWLPTFGLWTGIALTVIYNRETREREHRLMLAQAQAYNAQLQALRYQINPHLLYNTLNSIAALIIDKQNDLAEEMIIRLSDFFRCSLSTPTHSCVPLADEIALQQLYLAIEDVRIGERLTYEFNVAEEAKQVKVPSLILQPLVENALKHGLNANGRNTHVEIIATRCGQTLCLEVSDNGPGISAKKGTGVGLENVRNRLYAHYGSRAKIETFRSEPGFRVLLTIPV